MLVDSNKHKGGKGRGRLLQLWVIGRYLRTGLSIPNPNPNPNAHSPDDHTH